MMGRSAFRELAEDFVSGGFLVAVALWLAHSSSPVIGGVITGLPIRFAATWLLAARRRGAAYAERMARGSVMGMAGNILFSVTLFFVLLPLGFVAGFLVALSVCVASVLILKATFRE